MDEKRLLQDLGVPNATLQRVEYFPKTNKVGNGFKKTVAVTNSPRQRLVKNI